jgi:hypothetical protein
MYGPAPEDWIDGALGFVEERRWPLLRRFIHDLLNGEYSNAQLQEVYRNTYTELRFGDDKELRLFLEMVRDRIDQKLAKE